MPSFIAISLLIFYLIIDKKKQVQTDNGKLNVRFSKNLKKQISLGFLKSLKNSCLVKTSIGCNL